MKSFAFSLAFIMRFTATRKWPIINLQITLHHGPGVTIKRMEWSSFSKSEWEGWGGGVVALEIGKKQCAFSHGGVR